MVRGWHQRKKIRQELRALMKEQGLEELVMSQEEVYIYNAKRKLRKPILEFVKRFRARNLKKFMAIKI